MQRETRCQVAGMVVLGGVVLTTTLIFSPRAALRELEALAGRPLLFGVALVICYLMRPLVGWPITLFSALLGYLYGLTAFPVALAGAVVTSLPPYALARTTGDAGLLGWAGATGRRYFEAAGDIRGVVVARLAPLPSDPVSYGAGLSGVSPGAFAAGTALGETPWTMGAVLVGSSMSALTGEGVDIGLPLIAGGALLALLVLAGPLYSHLFGEGGQAAGG